MAEKWRHINAKIWRILQACKVRNVEIKITKREGRIQYTDDPCESDMHSVKTLP